MSVASGANMPNIAATPPNAIRTTPVAHTSPDREAPLDLLLNLGLSRRGPLLLPLRCIIPKTPLDACMVVEVCEAAAQHCDYVRSGSGAGWERACTPRDESAMGVDHGWATALN